MDALPQLLGGVESPLQFSGRFLFEATQTICILEVAVKTEGEILEAAVVVPAATVEELVAPWAVKAAVGEG